MINTLFKKRNDDNKWIVDALIRFIELRDIDSTDELNKYQVAYLGDSNLSSQVERATNITLSSLCDMDDLEDDEFKEVYYLKIDLKNTSNIEDKIKLLLRIFVITKSELMFFKTAYEYILEGKL